MAYRSPWFLLEGYRACTVKEDGVKRTALEHREVMESALGRPLAPSEIVHHKDGNKLNNAPDNLELMSVSDHTSHHHATGDELVVIICARCGTAATKKARNVRGNKKKGKAGPFCGRSCAGKFSTGA